MRTNKIMHAIRLHQSITYCWRTLVQSCYYYEVNLRKICNKYSKEQNDLPHALIIIETHSEKYFNLHINK